MPPVGFPCAGVFISEVFDSVVFTSRGFFSVMGFRLFGSGVFDSFFISATFVLFVSDVLASAGFPLLVSGIFASCGLLSGVFVSGVLVFQLLMRPVTPVLNPAVSCADRMCCLLFTLTGKRTFGTISPASHAPCAMYLVDRRAGRSWSSRALHVTFLPHALDAAHSLCHREVHRRFRGLHILSLDN